tara:strand:- start:601 stop:1158 length:558 start_codon:yes stop_codon:yes gene_type:complete
MKLQKIHIFLILLLSLIFCSCLGGLLREGMSSQRSITGSDGNSATATTGPQGNTAITGPQGNTAVVDNYASSNTYSGPAGNSATVTSGPQGNTAVTTNYSNGIQSNDIPQGQQDLYILKSQIVPPVCPVCPQAAACPRQDKCPPCPACARCPEPAFDCKKVPNYSSSNDNYLPRPVLADFSQFGM